MRDVDMILAQVEEETDSGLNASDHNLEAGFRSPLIDGQINATNGNGSILDFP